MKIFFRYFLFYTYLFSLFIVRNAFAAQGMYIETNNDIGKQLSYRIDQSRCLKPFHFNLNGEVYLEADDHPVSCLSIGSSYFKIRFFYKKVSIASYIWQISRSGSTITPIQENLPSEIRETYDLAEHDKLFGSQDIALIGFYHPVDAWMGDIADQIGKLKLKNVIFPGTHDSATYAITTSSPLVPDEKRRFLYKLFPSIVAAWSKTQPNTISEQLNSGIRYFDFRVCQSGGDYYACHGMLSARYKDIFQQIRYFITNPKHSREILILDFNHLYNMRTEDHQHFIDLLKHNFHDFLTPNSLGPDITLDALWQHHYRIIAIYGDSISVDHNAQYLWRENKIMSPWPNVTEVSKLLLYLNADLTDIDRKSKLFVFQGILTEDKKMVAKGIIAEGPASIKRMAMRLVNKPFLQWIKDKMPAFSKSADDPGGIIIQDWSNGYDLTELAKSLNIKKAAN